MLVSIGELRGSLSCFAAEGNNLAEEAAIRRGDLRSASLCVVCSLGSLALRAALDLRYFLPCFLLSRGASCGVVFVRFVCSSARAVCAPSGGHLFKNYKNCEETKTSL